MTSITPPPMLTSRFRAVADLRKVTPERAFLPVRTSVGLPRFMVESKDWPAIGVLAPYGLMKIQDEDQFYRAYHARLTKFGLEKITWVLRKVYDEQPEGERWPLALLCFEDLEKDRCHRRAFANWWLELTGDLIPECNTAADLAALPGVPA